MLLYVNYGPGDQGPGPGAIAWSKCTQRGEPKLGEVGEREDRAQRAPQVVGRRPEWRGGSHPEARQAGRPSPSTRRPASIAQPSGVSLLDSRARRSRQLAGHSRTPPALLIYVDTSVLAGLLSAGAAQRACRASAAPRGRAGNQRPDRRRAALFAFTSRAGAKLVTADRELAKAARALGVATRLLVAA